MRSRGARSISHATRRSRRATNSAGSSTARPSSCWRRTISNSATMSPRERGSNAVSRCCESRPRSYLALYRCAKETEFACTILGRLVDHGLLGKQRIVRIYDVFQQTHFVDAEPSQFRVLVADVGRVTASPTRNGINMMQRISIDFRLPLPDGCD